MHTPGPWNVTRYGLQVYDKDLNLITKIEQLACIGGSDDLAAQRASDREQANARLIAAAPELLDAAIQCLAALGSVDVHGYQNSRCKGKAIEQARAAIAKAKGE